MIYYELDKAEQKKYLHAIAFGKLFLNGDQNLSHKFKKYVVEIAVNLKVWWSVKEKTGRPITFHEFEHLLKFNEDTFVQILINRQEFQTAFNLFHSRILSKNFEKIFREYTATLLCKIEEIKRLNPAVDLKKLQLECADNIVKSYEKVKQMTHKIDSNILIDLANLAQSRDMTEIADKLLEKDNPIIVKIQTYLKMNMLPKAFQQALLAQNSNALYLAFDKLSQKNEQELFNKVRNTNDLIREHFYRFLKIKNLSLLNNIPDILQFYFYNVDDSFNLNKQLQLVKQALTLDSKNSLFIFAKRMIEKAIGQKEEQKGITSFSQNVTVYDLVKNEFSKKKNEYF